MEDKKQEILDFECPDCKGIFAKSVRCKNTGKCIYCSEDYEPEDKVECLEDC